MRKTFIMTVCLLVLAVAVSCSGEVGGASSQAPVEITSVKDIKEVVSDISVLTHYKALLAGDEVSMGIGSYSTSKGIGNGGFNYQWISHRPGQPAPHPVIFVAVDDKATDFEGNPVPEGETISQEEVPATIDKIYVLDNFTFISYLNVDLERLIEEADTGEDQIDGHVEVDGEELSFSYERGSSTVRVTYTKNNNPYTENVRFRSAVESDRPENERQNVTDYDTYDYFTSPFRTSFIVDNSTGELYSVSELNFSIHNGMVYEKTKGPVVISISAEGLDITPIVCNQDIYVYSFFTDVYGRYYVLNDSFNGTDGKFLYFTKPGSYIPAADGKVLHIEFNNSVIWNSAYGDKAHTECIQSIKFVGPDFTTFEDIPENYEVQINYSAKTDFENMPQGLADFNKANGFNSRKTLPENGSWYTFTRISGGYLYGNLFRGDSAMNFIRISLSDYSIRLNYYYAEKDESYYSLGGEAALVISNYLHNDGTYGVYVVYPFEKEEYRQRAFDIIIKSNGSVEEKFNTSDPNFEDIQNYNDFRKKFYHYYLILNSDVYVYDEVHPELDYPHDEVYDYDKGHNVFKYYVWKEGFSEQTFRDLYYKDSYDREEMGKHTLLEGIKYSSSEFRKNRNPFDLNFQVVDLSKTEVYRIVETPEGYEAVLVNTNLPRNNAETLQPINRTE